MGQLLDSLFGNDPVMSVDVDFQNEQAGSSDFAEENAIVADINHFMQRAIPLLRGLNEYAGCAEAIRAAMANPKNDAIQDKAMESLIPNIASIKSYYELAQQLGPLIHRAVVLLGSSEEYLQQFTRYRALSRGLGALIVFMFDFDQTKMMKPDVQNDFAFYRRMLPKMAGRRSLVVTEGDAGLISMFIAQSVPFMHAVGMHLANEEAPPRPLAKLANLCCGMLQRQSVHGEGVLHVLKIMTASIVLYDRVNPVGAYSPHTPVQLRRCAQVITRFGGGYTENLRNCIKFSSLHYNDPGTPEWVKAVFGD